MVPIHRVINSQQSPCNKHIQQNWTLSVCPFASNCQNNTLYLHQHIFTQWQPERNEVQLAGVKKKLKRENKNLHHTSKLISFFWEFEHNMFSMMISEQLRDCYLRCLFSKFLSSPSLLGPSSSIPAPVPWWCVVWQLLPSLAMVKWIDYEQ